MLLVLHSGFSAQLKKEKCVIRPACRAYRIKVLFIRCVNFIKQVFPSGTARERGPLFFCALSAIMKSYTKYHSYQEIAIRISSPTGLGI